MNNIKLHIIGSETFSILLDELNINYTIISDNKGNIAMAARKEDNHLINIFNKFLDHFEKSDEYKLLKEFYFK